MYLGNKENVLEIDVTQYLQLGIPFKLHLKKTLGISMVICGDYSILRIEFTSQSKLD